MHIVIFTNFAIILNIRRPLLFFDLVLSIGTPVILIYNIDFIASMSYVPEQGYFVDEGRFLTDLTSPPATGDYSLASSRIVNAL